MFSLAVTSVGINDSGRWYVSFSDDTSLEFSSEEDYIAYCTGSTLASAASESVRRLAASLVFNSSTNIGRVIVFNPNDVDGNFVKG